MRQAILLVGPRGAGKSTWLANNIAYYEGAVSYSRDEFLAKNFPDGFCRYNFPIEIGIEAFWKDARDREAATPSQTVFYDYWTGFVGERRRVVEKLREMGFDKVFAYWVRTPKETTIAQFLQREGSAYTRHSAEWDWSLFHENVADLTGDVDCPFDGVSHINHAQLSMSEALHA